MSRKQIHLDKDVWDNIRSQANLSKYKDENAVKAECKEIMESAGAFDIGSGVTMGMGKSHTSDQKWLLQGVFIAIECKWDVQERGGPTTGQTQYLRDVKKHKGIALVVDRNNINFLRAAVEASNNFSIIPEFGLLDVEWCAKDLTDISW